LGTIRGADSIGHGGDVPPLLQMAGHGEQREWNNSKQETDLTVQTITKALTIIVLQWPLSLCDHALH